MKTILRSTSLVILMWLCFTCNTTLVAQTQFTFEELGNGRYTDGTSIGKFYNMKHVFQDDGIMEWMYSRYNQNRKAENVFNVITIINIGLGILVGGAVGRTGSATTGTVVGAIVGVFVGAASGLPYFAVGRIFHGYKNKRKKQLISYYNDKVLPNLNSDQSYLMLGFTNHGVGLVYQF